MNNSKQPPILVPVNVYKSRLAAINYARGSVRLEGFHLSPEVEAIHQQYARGDITAAERLQAVIRFHKQ